MRNLMPMEDRLVGVTLVKVLIVDRSYQRCGVLRLSAHSQFECPERAAPGASSRICRGTLG